MEKFQILLAIQSVLLLKSVLITKQLKKIQKNSKIAQLDTHAPISKKAIKHILKLLLNVHIWQTRRKNPINADADQIANAHQILKRAIAH